MESYMNKKMEPAFQKFVIPKQGLAHITCNILRKIIKNKEKFSVNKSKQKWKNFTIRKAHPLRSQHITQQLKQALG